MSTNTKCSLQKLSFQFSLKRDALEVLPQVKHLDKAVLTQLCLSWVLIILQPGTLEAEACSYGKGLPATRFFLLLHGLQSLYKSIPPHDCYKRGNGLSVNFLSQCCLHDAGLFGFSLHLIPILSNALFFQYYFKFVMSVIFLVRTCKLGYCGCAAESEFAQVHIGRPVSRVSYQMPVPCSAEYARPYIIFENNGELETKVKVQTILCEVRVTKSTFPRGLLSCHPT
jgi:hypothetical protein